MAERLKKLPAKSRGPGRPPKYPWDQWSDGSVWRATSGTDFDCSRDGFVDALRQFAHRNRDRLRVSVRMSNDEPDVVIFQFFDREGERSGQPQANGKGATARKVRRPKR